MDERKYESMKLNKDSVSSYGHEFKVQDLWNSR